MASPYAFDAAAMNSWLRSSRRAISRASWLSLACARWLSQVATLDVRPSTTDPASADSVERYAISIWPLIPTGGPAIGSIDHAFAIHGRHRCDRRWLHLRGRRPEVLSPAVARAAEGVLGGSRASTTDRRLDRRRWL